MFKLIGLCSRIIVVRFFNIEMLLVIKPFLFINWKVMFKNGFDT